MMEALYHQEVKEILEMNAGKTNQSKKKDYLNIQTQPKSSM